MDSETNDESLQSKRSTFRKSIQQFVHEQDATISSPRRSIRQQKKDELPVKSIATTPHISARKRRTNTLEHDLSEPEGTSSPSKSMVRSPKRKKGYAPPETYAHLRELNDCIKMHLDVLFCGINPGVLSATVGHHFAHPSNRFYKALHGSGTVNTLFHDTFKTPFLTNLRKGLTDERVDPSEDYTLPDRYNIGITDLVDRPSASADQLKKVEFRDATPTLLRKIAKYKPRIVCFVGMGMYTEVEKVLEEMIATADIEGVLLERVERPYLKKEGKRELTPGLRPYKLVYPPENDVGFIGETLFFSSPSTSGLAATYQEKDLIKLYSQLRSLVCSHKDKSIDTSGMQIIPTLSFK